MPKEEGDLVLKILQPKGNFNRAVEDLLKKGRKFLYLAPAEGSEILEKRKDYQIARLADGSVGLIQDRSPYVQLYLQERLEYQCKSADGCQQGKGCGCDEDCPGRKK